jgi:hypothetical protein
MKTLRNWSQCKSCGAKITWTRTDAGKPMPIDGHQHASKWVPSLGNHWATCSSANQHKKQARRSAQLPAEPAAPNHSDLEYLGFTIRMIPLLSPGRFLVRIICPGLPLWEWLGAEHDSGLAWALSVCEKNPWPIQNQPNEET